MKQKYLNVRLVWGRRWVVDRGESVGGSRGEWGRIGGRTLAPCHDHYD